MQQLFIITHKLQKDWLCHWQSKEWISFNWLILTRRARNTFIYRKINRVISPTIHFIQQIILCREKLLSVEKLLDDELSGTQKIIFWKKFASDSVCKFFFSNSDKAVFLHIIIVILWVYFQEYFDTELFDLLYWSKQAPTSLQSVQSGI